MAMYTKSQAAKVEKSAFGELRSALLVKFSVTPANSFFTTALQAFVAF